MGYSPRGTAQAITIARAPAFLVGLEDMSGQEILYMLSVD